MAEELAGQSFLNRSGRVCKRGCREKRARQSGAEFPTLPTLREGWAAPPSCLVHEAKSNTFSFRAMTAENTPRYLGRDGLS